MIPALRRTEPADLSFILECEADPGTAPYILPWTHERHLHAVSEPDCAHLVLCDPNDGTRLGFAMLFGLVSPHRAIEFRRVVVARKGQGVGRAALRAIKALAFGELAAHRLWLDVKSRNARARYLYRSEGFTEEGVMRECLREEDGYESLVLMSMLRHEYAGAGPSP